MPIITTDKKDDGGPAFPHQQYERVGQIERSDSTGGMTLRDYFAAKAMQSLLLHPNLSQKEEGEDWDVYYDKIAGLAYDVADSMIYEKTERK